MNKAKKWGNRKQRDMLRERLASKGHDQEYIAARLADLVAADEDPEALRRHLTAEGYEPALVAKLVDDHRVALLHAALGHEGAIAALHVPQPPDSNYRPRSVDSTLTGTGRATGNTAKSIKRRRGLAKWECDTA